MFGRPVAARKKVEEAIRGQQRGAEVVAFGLNARGRVHRVAVAGDLRFLVAATRMLYELERTGDLAFNCVKMLKRLNGFPSHPAITPLLEASITASCKVFAQGIDALDAMQPDAGAVLDEADDEVDDVSSSDAGSSSATISWTRRCRRRSTS